MLNLRTVTLSFALLSGTMLLAVVAAVRLAASPAQAQPRSADLAYVDGQHLYRASLGVCFDVAVRDLAACQHADQKAAPVYRVPGDVCFDVPVREMAACRLSDQKPGPSRLHR